MKYQQKRPEIVDFLVRKSTNLRYYFKIGVTA
jgi:hypothetical protein